MLCSTFTRIVASRLVHQVHSMVTLTKLWEDVRRRIVFVLFQHGLVKVGHHWAPGRSSCSSTASPRTSCRCTSSRCTTKWASASAACCRAATERMNESDSA
jgi:hypothetical protein